MRAFWMTLVAALGPVAALLNKSIPASNTYAITAGAPQPAMGAGAEVIDYEDFMELTPLDDESWEKLKCKGENLINAMHASDEQAGKYWNPILPSAESIWEDFSDLAGWYWHQQTGYEATMINFLDDKPELPGFGIGDAIAGLGLPDTPNAGCQIIYVAHADYSLENLDKNDPKHKGINDQTYTVGATTYRATGGYYRFGINTSNGAIIGIDRRSPEDAATKSRKPPISKDGLPSLQRYSDVAWLFWAKKATTPNNLKHFITVAIGNEETQRAIRRALSNVHAAYAPWPGTTFSTSSDEGKVLLGSANGRAHGYFLAQHKRQLGGNMYISRIRVFHGDTEPLAPNMVLYVEQPRAAKKVRRGRGRKGRSFGRRVGQGGPRAKL